MIKNNNMWVAQGNESIYLIPRMLNRHGLIAGATGTGKTITLKVFAENLSTLGIPVFLADIKGDVSGLGSAGIENENVAKRVAKFGIDPFSYQGFPVEFWDIYGENGLPIRTTISNMGPTLLSKLLNLNDTQTSVLSVVFTIADENELLLIDIKDLRSMLQFVADNAKELQPKYGNISTQTIGAITRSLVVLESQGGDIFFGEPDLDILDWMRTNNEGLGIINILDSVKLIQNPSLYSTFLLWMLSELFEVLPEVGDLDKPKMVFVFDEAHLLFKDTPKVLVEKIEQVVRLIRSKGVGVYFVTQSPNDLPESILAQLGNKIQHALRAFTPAEQKNIKAAAASFRANPDLDTETVLTELGTGEALISFLDEEGKPSIVQRAYILPPQSLMSVIDDNERTRLIHNSPFNSKYAVIVDRESAYEVLDRKFKQEVVETTAPKVEETPQEKAPKKEKKSDFQKQAEKMLNTATKEITQGLLRGILDSFTKK